MMTASTGHLGTQADEPDKSKPSPFIAFVVGITLLVGIVFAIFAASSEAAATGTGTVTVGDDVFTFAASTCTISEGDFVVAGPGRTDGTPFWVSASGRDITVSVGVESELEQPDLSRLWLSNDGPIKWQFDGSTVEATTVLFDVRQPNRAIPASLAASCEPTVG